LKKENISKGDSELIIEGLKLVNVDLKRDLNNLNVNFEANKKAY